MKAPESTRSTPMRVARAVGYATAAVAYLTFLVIAGANAGSVGTDPTEFPARVEVAAR